MFNPPSCFCFSSPLSFSFSVSLSLSLSLFLSLCLSVSLSLSLQIDYSEKELDRFMRRAKNSMTGSLTNSLELTLTASNTQSHTTSGSLTPTHCNHQSTTCSDEPVSLSDGELLQEEKKSPRKVREWEERERRERERERGREGGREGRRGRGTSDYRVILSLFLYLPLYQYPLGSNDYSSRDVWDIDKLDPLDRISNHDDDDEIEIAKDNRRMSQKHGHASKDQDGDEQ